MTGPRGAVLLVRHGESTWNRAGRVQGQVATPGLTRRGRVQARALAATLAPAGVTRIITSDLRRAVQTAAIIGRASGVEPETSALLRERHWGTWQGRSREAAEAHARTLAADEPLPGGESEVEVRQRLVGLLSDLVEPAGVLVLVTHGDVITSLLGTGVVPNGSVHPAPLTTWDTPTPVGSATFRMCKGVRTL